MTRFPVVSFHQFGSETDEDLMYVFAAPATVLASWAGIPRKGWRVRMLYQRWVTLGREREVRRFWDDAGDYQSATQRFLLGPTALTLAANESLDINEEGIRLAYSRPFALDEGEYVQMGKAARIALERVSPRLTDDERSAIVQMRHSLDYEPTEYEPNHILTSAIQIAQLAADAESFCDYHQIDDQDRSELLEALEALCRPALVVDGQHRLLGAAASKHAVVLPVVVIPNANWLEQIYQFVVINDTAKRVPPDLLTDIFGNSLTPTEQDTVRLWLANSNVQVEARIAAVIAGTHPASPFQGLVRLKLGQDQRSKGYITETTIRQLIDGGRGGTSGWRTDPAFYENYVRPTVPQSEDWDSWTNGRWREYWFAFWAEVASFYNEETSGPPLWGAEQTNLTKAVTLRLMQDLFMSTCVKKAQAASLAAVKMKTAFETLGDEIDEDRIEALLTQTLTKETLPNSIDDFRVQVRAGFLAKGVPVRVFEKPWVKSLDDEAGINELREELRKAYELCQEGLRYKAQNKAIFSVGD